MGADGLRHLVESERREKIVLVDAGKKLAARQCEGAVCVFGDAQILREKLKPEPRLLRLPGL